VKTRINPGPETFYQTINRVQRGVLQQKEPLNDLSAGSDISTRNFLFYLTNSMEQVPSLEDNSHTVKKFPAFYGARRFITVFTTAYHWSLSWFITVFLS